MTTTQFPRATNRWAALLLGALLSFSALALPGAHGPNGEHLDAPTQAGASAAPRLEAKSELFELVATLAGGELSILVDRFDTNEPVLGGKVEVECGLLQAVAKFHADLGDYSVEDPALLAALAKPGEHALVFTVLAGDQTDLLDGTLKVAAQEVDHDHGHGADDHGIGLRKGALIAGGLLLALAVITTAMRRRSPARGAMQ
jgi:hypothetical protein